MSRFLIIPDIHQDLAFLSARLSVTHPAPEARQKGRSWCIDCAQQAYGVVEDGELVVRGL